MGSFKVGHSSHISSYIVAKLVLMTLVVFDSRINLSAGIPIFLDHSLLNRSISADSLKYSGLFPIDGTLEGWLRGRATIANMYKSTDLVGPFTLERFSHHRIDELFVSPLSADKGAKYAKYLYLNLSTLSPYVSGPNSVKVATPLEEYVFS